MKKGKKKYNQAHYEALGEVSDRSSISVIIKLFNLLLCYMKVITKEVYHLLEMEANLKKVDIPVRQSCNY